MSDPQASATDVVDMNGWHTVSALSYAAVNKSIAADGNYPGTFSQAAPDGSVTLSGCFGPWSLTTGGAGPLLKMALPITGGKLTINGPPSTQLAVPPCTATIEVHANFLPQPQGAQQRDLRLDLSPHQGSVVNVNNQMDPPLTNFLLASEVPQLLALWLNDNLSQFNHVFASVNLDADLSQAGVPWLAASHLGYAVAEPTKNATQDNCVFGVLCLIDGAQPPDGLAMQVSLSAIPPSAEAGFVISQDKFLQHMLLRSLPLMFAGIALLPAADYFALSADGTTISNTRPLQLLPTTMDDGKVINPALATGSFTLEVDATELKLMLSDMRFDYPYLGIFHGALTVHLNYEATYTLQLDSAKGIIDLAVPAQRSSGSVTESKGLRITDEVLGIASIILSVLGLGGKAITKLVGAAIELGNDAANLGAAMAEASAPADMTQDILDALNEVQQGAQRMKSIGAVAAGITKVGLAGAAFTGLLPALDMVLKALANDEANKVPHIGTLVQAGIDNVVTWPKSIGDFQLSSVQLNQSLQFGLVRRQ
jgi:hypothetical protein